LRIFFITVSKEGVAPERNYIRKNRSQLKMLDSDGDDATRPLPRDKGAEEFHGDPTIGPHPKV